MNESCLGWEWMMLSRIKQGGFDSDEVADAFSALDQAWDASGRKEKMQALGNQVLNEVLKSILWLTYNRFITYGVAQLREKRIRPREEGGVEHFEAFTRILLRLSNRELTGHDARVELEDFFCRCSVYEVEWYQKILNRDLECGIQPTTINAVWENLIPTFKFQQCATYEDARDELDLSGGHYYAEPKMNGIRAFAFTDGEGKVEKILSGSGLEIHNTDHIRKAIARLRPRRCAKVIDFELQGDLWNNTQSLTMTTTKMIDASGLKAHIFDELPSDDFYRGYCPIPQIDRSRELWRTLENLPKHSPLIKVKRVRIQSDEDAQALLEQAFEQGYEGIVIKDGRAPWKAQRWLAWLKVKMTIDIDVPVIGCVLSKRYAGQKVMFSEKDDPKDRNPNQRKRKKIKTPIKQACREEVSELKRLGLISDETAMAILKHLDSLQEVASENPKEPPWVVIDTAIRSLTVRDQRNDGEAAVLVNVGGGLTVAQRVVYARCMDDLRGNIIEICGQYDPKPAATACRYPHFRRWRRDKPPLWEEGLWSLVREDNDGKEGQTGEA